MRRRARPSGPRRGLTRGSTLILLATAASLGCDESGPAGPGVELSISLELVASGLEQPIYLASPPGDADRLFVVEREGMIRVVRDGTVAATPFLDIEDLVTTEGDEQGLLGLAFHPSYATNGWFYVNYTDDDGDTRIVRYTASANPDVADPGSAFPILTIRQPAPNHNGGMLEFGPDGKLYVAVGDGGAGNSSNGQDLSTLLGSLLRIDVDAGSPYAVPPDNPFVGNAAAEPELWAKGLRNPWRFSFDRETGDLLIADVGEDAMEEISFQPASSGGGENYGWDVREGSTCIASPSACSAGDFVAPIHEYDHGDGCSITGGYVYRGSRSPDLEGRYFFSDFCGSWLRSFALTNGQASDVREHTPTSGSLAGVASFGEDDAGEIYVLSMFAGTVHRIVSP